MHKKQTNKFLRTEIETDRHSTKFFAVFKSYSNLYKNLISKFLYECKWINSFGIFWTIEESIKCLLNVMKRNCTIYSYSDGNNDQIDRNIQWLINYTMLLWNFYALNWPKNFWNWFKFNWIIWIPLEYFLFVAFQLAFKM